MERRHYHRFSYSAEARLCADEHISHVHLLDLSLKGALLENSSSKQFTHDQPCTLSIELSEGDQQIHMQGHIAHSRDNHLGFMCDSMDISSATELRRLVELNLADEALLQRDLRALVE